ncbi:MAG TPA: CPBP family intramembrane glutamic endopeptidase [Burkholderiaceae bacterium]
MKPAENLDPTPLEFAGIMFLCFGWFIANSVAALFVGTEGMNFSNSTLLEMVLFEVFQGTLALLVLRQRGHVLSELIPAPRRQGIAIGCLLYMAVIATHLAAMAVLGTHQQGQPIEHIMNAAKPSMVLVLLLALVNGYYEEVFALGYVMRAVGKHGASFAIGMSTLIRLAYHLYQGPIGAMFVVFFSIVMGTWYWRTRNLWPCIVAHILGDVMPFVLQ